MAVNVKNKTDNKKGKCLPTFSLHSYGLPNR